MKRSPLAVLLLGLVVALATGATADEKKQEAELKCPISGKPAKTEISAEHRGGEVYFCCPGCPPKFKENAEKFSTKANHQLIASGQAEQIACPLTGRDVNPSTATKVEGVMIAFCCNGCKGKTEKADEEKRREMLFGDKAFEKGFKVEQKEKKEG